MNLTLNDGMELLNVLVEEKRREEVWDMWIAVLPNYSEDTYKSFEEFYNELTTPQISTRSKEDILADYEKIQKNKAQN
jgi:hypothetical protein